MSQYRFPKSCRLRKRHEFVSLSKNGNIFKGKALFISWRKTKYPVSRLGITVTKKYGDAVARNRFKRLVREAFRLSRHHLDAPVDCNVRPVNGVIPSIEEIIKDLMLFFTECK